MAHLVESMAYSGETPWHGLGKKVRPNLSPDEILEDAGLDWEVVEVPLLAPWKVLGPDGVRVKKTTYLGSPDKALIRKSKDPDVDGSYLDTVSGDWQPLQNKDAFSIFEDVVKAGGMTMETAGSLDKGRMVWALARVGDGFTVGRKDRVDSFLLLSNPHRYGKSINGCYTGIRVVCNNTLTAALGIAGANVDLRAHHRQKFDVEAAKTLLGVSAKSMAHYKEAAQFLAKKRYNNKTLGEYLVKVFPTTAKANDNDKGGKIITLSKPAKQAITLVETQPGAAMAPGTWWNAFNSVTFLTDHVLGNNADTRLKSAWYGPNRERKTKALDLAVEFAKAA